MDTEHDRHSGPVRIAAYLYDLELRLERQIVIAWPVDRIEVPCPVPITRWGWEPGAPPPHPSIRTETFWLVGGVLRSWTDLGLPPASQGVPVDGAAIYARRAELESAR